MSREKKVEERTNIAAMKAAVAEAKARRGRAKVETANEEEVTLQQVTAIARAPAPGRRNGHKGLIFLRLLIVTAILITLLQKTNIIK